MNAPSPIHFPDSDQQRKRMQRILVIQTKRIGDLILTAPALRLLRRRRPKAHITLVTAGVAGQLAECIPGIDEHLNYCPGKLNAALWSTLFSEPFDFSLDFNGTDRSVGMSFAAGAHNRSAYTKRALKFPRNAIFTHRSPASLKKLHTIDHMVALLETMDIFPDADREALRLEIPESAQQQTRQVLSGHGIEVAQPFAVIHPGTARPEKYWLPSAWAAVIDQLILKKNLPVIITGGGDAEEIAHIESIKKAVKSEARSKLIDLSGTISLPQTAAVISRSTVVLGVDTAAMHLAAAFEKPQIVLFGPTNPYHWRPLHKQARVILAGHDKALREVEFETKIPEFSMSLITEKQVIKVLNEQLGSI